MLYKKLDRGYFCELLIDYVDAYNRDPDTENSWARYYKLEDYLLTVVIGEVACDFYSHLKKGENNKYRLNYKDILKLIKILESQIKHQEEYEKYLLSEDIRTNGGN